MNNKFMATFALWSSYTSHPLGVGLDCLYTTLVLRRDCALYYVRTRLVTPVRMWDFAPDS